MYTLTADAPLASGPSRPDAPDAMTQKLLLLGEATFLFLNSPLHLGYAVHQLTNFILTPLRLGQFRMYRSAKGPVGFVAWARLTPQAAEDYALQRRPLKPEDWNAGDQLWFIEFIAPFGHGPRIVADLRQNIFPGERAQSLRRHADGRLPMRVQWRGVAADTPAAVATNIPG